MEEMETNSSLNPLQMGCFNSHSKEEQGLFQFLNKKRQFKLNLNNLVRTMESHLPQELLELKIQALQQMALIRNSRQNHHLQQEKTQGEIDQLLQRLTLLLLKKVH